MRESYYYTTLHLPSSVFLFSLFCFFFPFLPFSFFFRTRFLLWFHSFPFVLFFILFCFVFLTCFFSFNFAYFFFSLLTSYISVSISSFRSICFLSSLYFFFPLLFAPHVALSPLFLISFLSRSFPFSSHFLYSHLFPSIHFSFHYIYLPFHDFITSIEIFPFVYFFLR